MRYCHLIGGSGYPSDQVRYILKAFWDDKNDSARADGTRFFVPATANLCRNTLCIARRVDKAGAEKIRQLPKSISFLEDPQSTTMKEEFQMRTLKKALSLVLVLAMVFTLAVPALAVDKAADFKDYDKVENLSLIHI